MPSTGRLVSLALSGGLVVVIALSGCGDGESAELEDRVRELEDENTALREQLAALEEDGVGVAPTTEPGVASTTTGDTGAATTSTSVAAASTTSTSPAVAIAGARESPHPVGDEFRAGDWTLQVVGFEGNADPAVASLSPDNPPATPGNVYLRFRLRAVYNGDGGGDPGRIRLNLLSPTGATVGPADVCCDPQRVALGDQPETFPGGVVEGWLYYQVVAADLFEGPFLAFQPDADQAGLPGGVVFFAIN